MDKMYSREEVIFLLGGWTAVLLQKRLLSLASCDILQPLLDSFADEYMNGQDLNMYMEAAKAIFTPDQAKSFINSVVRSNNSSN